MKLLINRLSNVACAKWTLFLIIALLFCVCGYSLVINHSATPGSTPCSIHSPSTEGPLYLVCTGDGTVDTVDAYGQQRLMGKQEEYGYCSFGSGRDDISGSSYTVMRLPDDAATWVHISNGDTIMAMHDIKNCFCDACSQKIKDALPWNQRHTYVLFDAVAEEFHPISVGTEQIGNYIVEASRESGGLSVVVTTLE